MIRSYAAALSAAALIAGAAAAQETAAAPAEESQAELTLVTSVAKLTTSETLDELGYLEIDPASIDGRRVVAEVSQYLNGLDTLSGRFLQVSYEGDMASGDFYLDRPGKARFAYDPPHPSLIVSDGRTVAHEDRDLETVDRVPLRATPLNLFLKSEVNLARDTEIIAIVAGPGEIVLTAHDPDGEMEGEVTFVFAAPSLELREWIVVNALDQQVRVILSDIQHGENFDPALFVLRDRGRGPGRRR